MNGGWESIDEDAPRPANTLVATTESRVDPPRPGTTGTHRIGVVGEVDIEDWLAAHGSATTQERLTLLTVGEFVRSGTSVARASTNPSGVPQIVSIEDPAALDDIGDQLATTLRSGDRDVILEFDALDDLLDAAPLPAVFTFLHMVTRLVEDADATARYRLDPDQHDPATVATIEPLFDAAF